MYVQLLENMAFAPLIGDEILCRIFACSPISAQRYDRDDACRRGRHSLDISVRVASSQRGCGSDGPLRLLGACSSLAGSAWLTIIRNTFAWWNLLLETLLEPQMDASFDSISADSAAHVTAVIAITVFALAFTVGAFMLSAFVADCVSKMKATEKQNGKEELV